MEGLKLVPYIALLLAISGVIVGAGVMVSASFGDTIQQPCLNGSFSINKSTPGNYFCDNNTDGVLVGNTAGNFSNEYFTIAKSLEGQTDLAEQLPTVAIIAIMVIIISIIAGVFVYMRYFS